MIDLTPAQRATLKEWKFRTERYEGFYFIHEVFQARNNKDNAHRRTMYRLQAKGLLVTGDAPAGCIPPIKSGCPLIEKHTEKCAGCGTAFEMDLTDYEPGGHFICDQCAESDHCIEALIEASSL